jgi:hypothetical protein
VATIWYLTVSLSEPQGVGLLAATVIILFLPLSEFAKWFLQKPQPYNYQLLQYHMVGGLRVTETFVFTEVMVLG